MANPLNGPFVGVLFSLPTIDSCQNGRFSDKILFAPWQDSEGKLVAQTSMKRSELESLGEGDRIFVGCKEVELGDPISTRDFLAGTCFDSGGVSGGCGGHGGDGISRGSSNSLPPLNASSDSAGNIRPFKTPMAHHSSHDNVRVSNGKAPSFKTGGKIYQ